MGPLRRKGTQDAPAPDEADGDKNEAERYEQESAEVVTHLPSLHHPGPVSLLDAWSRRWASEVEDAAPGTEEFVARLVRPVIGDGRVSARCP
ncbi:hypothetical protein GCM10010104_26260 [Streptomyces indiaensis]|uniref:Uncharacterized protein n=1 Tax=Streptomyces indiaensis TaxID=284033 RepID=A0ABN3DH73_9ACTN